MSITTEQLDDGMVKVTVEQNGMQSTGFVSSFHLVDPKAAQLKADIETLSREAFMPIHDA